MSTVPIERVCLRGIFDSRGSLTVEAELALACGAVGVGSSPLAIAPGRREQRRSSVRAPGRLDRDGSLAVVRERLLGQSFVSQAHFDDVLLELRDANPTSIGADTSLALSLAFARAAAGAERVPLRAYITELTGVSPGMPHPLVNIFSGGIHTPAKRIPFQQIMVAPRCASICEDIELALSVYSAIEKRHLGDARPVSYSASSGLIVDDASYETLLGELAEEIARYARPSASLTIAVDVAAEHLAVAPGLYRFGPRLAESGELAELLSELVDAYPISYIEDPFAPDDTGAWQTFVARHGARLRVAGDDLFATTTAYVRRDLANSIVLKMTQIGTLTATLDCARAARHAGLDICVSHRSGETEDTSMCDLAVAVGASSIKIGGPRRGDRLYKYNQLLRLDEALKAA